MGVYITTENPASIGGDRRVAKTNLNHDRRTTEIATANPASRLEGFHLERVIVLEKYSETRSDNTMIPLSAMTSTLPGSLCD